MFDDIEARTYQEMNQNKLWIFEKSQEEHVLLINR